MRRAAFLAIALAASLCGSGCISVPASVSEQFTPPPADGSRPNNYHACPICARAAREGRLVPGAPPPCLAAR